MCVCVCLTYTKISIIMRPFTSCSNFQDQSSTLSRSPNMTLFGGAAWRHCIVLVVTMLLCEGFVRVATFAAFKCAVGRFSPITRALAPTSSPVRCSSSPLPPPPPPLPPPSFYGSRGGYYGDDMRSCRDFQRRNVIRFARLFGSLGLGVSAGTGVVEPSLAIDRPIDDPLYNKALLNAPSDDFWYPPYLIGKWNTTMTFSNAVFTEKFSLDELSQNENLPGFSPYSIVFCPDMGKNVNLIRRFAQIDSHPREDHPYNIREIFRAFLGEEAVIETAAYSFQKAPNWIYSPANRWKITYRDSKGKGEIQLLTQKRDIQVTAGSVETTEFIRQEHRRFEKDTKYKEKLTVSDYALHWKLGGRFLLYSHSLRFLSFLPSSINLCSFNLLIRTLFSTYSSCSCLSSGRVHYSRKLAPIHRGRW